MKIPAHAPLHLLHQTPAGALATHSRDPRGFPYPTLLPFAPDARHRPVILVSRLAEHTRNLLDDPRAGFLVAHGHERDGLNVLDAPRATLLGRFTPVDAAAHAAEHAAIARRYLRYHPDAERYLALGDFTFWTMEVERLRYIGGFGAMGWLDAADLDPLDPLAADEEAELIHFFDTHAARPAGLRLAGVDRYGADLITENDGRTRFIFDTPQTHYQSLHAVLDDCIERHLA
ncbi:HugZ family pyridoxamine 5'-phosphate oxidase [Paraburkholderia acidisoli]|uniref:Pyridoxamine 5'-phosphate oxidase n=1 Tax=Paraburkholderia acidisoli TaxID=2571748 RepID=A0A7Z2JDW1_9BURK|nr:pyridoxamine 5'-phosphate oxidase family protein [Paraburkholderia acidisoli]QGZ60338.1 pyridoxamine 5'-phosphate oxidase [Paraburkholderia acidisoli]